MKKLVLFDIDGTILWTDGAGRRAIRDALQQEMGTSGPIETYRLDGKTDPQIVRELMTMAGHPDAESEAHIQRVLVQYVALLAEELETGRRNAKLFPGIEELISGLERRGDVVVGLLTGNVVGGAQLKLAAVGLDHGRFRLGAYGSDAAARSDLPPIAAKRAEPLMGRIPSGTDVVIIGDTPADVTCGNSIGARAIGVGTGHYTRQQLLEAGAFAAFDDLADVDLVMSTIIE
ncbi:MAG: HAD family hydrolase [Gemmatimonadetes bacterium]|nr:HAD family hydrolase [Gemmatimonadota bacterium]